MPPPTGKTTDIRFEGPQCIYKYIQNEMKKSNVSFASIVYTQMVLSHGNLISSLKYHRSFYCTVITNLCHDKIVFTKW